MPIFTLLSFAYQNYFCFFHFVLNLCVLSSCLNLCVLTSYLNLCVLTFYELRQVTSGNTGKTESTYKGSVWEFVCVADKKEYFSGLVHRIKKQYLEMD